MFVAFDILQLDNQILINYPLIERKKILLNNIRESEKIVYTRYIEEHGSKLTPVNTVNRPTI